MVLRIKQGHELERFEKVEANVQDQQLAQQIIQDLELLYSIHCPVGERDYLLLHIVSKK